MSFRARVEAQCKIEARQRVLTAIEDNELWRLILRLGYGQRFQAEYLHHTLVCSPIWGNRGPYPYGWTLVLQGNPPAGMLTLICPGGINQKMDQFATCVSYISNGRTQTLRYDGKDARTVRQFVSRNLLNEAEPIEFVLSHSPHRKQRPDS